MSAGDDGDGSVPRDHAGEQRERAAPGAKYAVPRPPRGLVARSRCDAALAETVAAHRLTVVTAPAGFGKTTLLAQWAATAPGPVVWVSLDPLDDEPGRLVRVLGDALVRFARVGGPDDGAAGALATVARRVDALVAVLEDVPAETVVVLDDVHLISARTAREVLGPVLRYGGPRFVLAGRYDAALPVNRMRMAGEVGELRERTLAFTEDEVAEVVRAVEVPADAAAVRALWEVTRGWPVAVRLALAADVLGRSGEPLAQLRDRDVPITGYLVEEVIGSLPDDLADFVLRASVATQLDPELAEALVPGGARLLDDCVGRGLFLTDVGGAGGPGDGGEPEEGPVYRWHALVAAHARAVLARRDPLAARVAHRVVAAHLGPRDPAAAIRHALDGHAPDLAARVLGERWPELVVRGDVGQVRGLRAALPPRYRSDPDVLLALAAAHAYEADGTGEDDGGPAWVGELVRTFLGPGRPPLEESVRRGRALLDDGVPGAGAPDDAVRALGLYLVGRAELQRYGPDPDALGHLAAGRALAAEHGWVALELGCRAEQALAAALRGEVGAALDGARSVLAAAALHDWQGASIVASAHLACGIASYWRDELCAAGGHLRAAVEAAGRTRREVAVHAAGVLAIVCLAQGDAPGLARAREITDAPWPDGSAPEHLTGFRDFLTAVQLGAEDRPRDALAIVDESSVAFADPLALGWQSDQLLRIGDIEGAERALHAAERAAAGAAVALGGTPAQVRVANLAAAAALHADEDAAAAHVALEAALAAAAPHGLVRPLRDRAAALHPLLSAHLEWGSAHEPLVTRLLVAEHEAPTPRASAWDLTPRERDVLACLRSSLTSEEIAGSLFLSINTVKTHMRAIYRKLGVDGRRAAVRTAVQRGLL
ncbi:LuxR C-terminal-related transcriptional regulator [Cellulomonas sp. IC4_254]|uniref:LuxR C-terminal-related transcriptional regulator n=1 Tax=Cellulomonas sp. IC4_254 TaxID=2714040 RepID=UPI001F0D0684|nr:LuxR C-terminal-related transcriptional regulator [Cellulomonas sp. IC4_254]